MTETNAAFSGVGGVPVNEQSLSASDSEQKGSIHGHMLTLLGRSDKNLLFSLFSKVANVLRAVWSYLSLITPSNRSFADLGQTDRFLKPHDAIITCESHSVIDVAAAIHEAKEPGSPQGFVEVHIPTMGKRFPHSTRLLIDMKEIDKEGKRAPRLIFLDPNGKSPEERTIKKAKKGEKTEVGGAFPSDGDFVNISTALDYINYLRKEIPEFKSCTTLEYVDSDIQRSFTDCTVVSRVLANAVASDPYRSSLAKIMEDVRDRYPTKQIEVIRAATFQATGGRLTPTEKAAISAEEADMAVKASDVAAAEADRAAVAAAEADRAAVAAAEADRAAIVAAKAAIAAEVAVKKAKLEASIAAKTLPKAEMAAGEAVIVAAEAAKAAAEAEIAVIVAAERAPVKAAAKAAAEKAIAKAAAEKAIAKAAAEKAAAEAAAKANIGAKAAATNNMSPKDIELQIITTLGSETKKEEEGPSKDKGLRVPKGFDNMYGYWSDLEEEYE